MYNSNKTDTCTIQTKHQNRYCLVIRGCRGGMSQASVHMIDTTFKVAIASVYINSWTIFYVQSGVQGGFLHNNGLG